MASRMDNYVDIFKEVTALAYTGTSAQTAVLVPVNTNITEYIACLSSANAVYVAKGTNPTATTSSLRIPANTMYHMKINTGERIAAIQETAAGNLSITLMK